MSLYRLSHKQVSYRTGGEGGGGRGGEVGNVDAYKGMHVHVSAAGRILYVLMKFWTYLRTRISYNTISLIIMMYFVIVLYTLL